MRQITQHIYEFDELSDEAKEKARKIFKDDHYFYGYHLDNETSLRAFYRMFDVDIKSWGYCHGRPNVQFHLSDLWYEYNILDMTGIRLLKYIINNFYDDITDPKPILKDGIAKCRFSKISRSRSCVLTGFYLDNVLLQPIYDFLAKPDENTTIYDLVKAGLDAWALACHEDVERCYSNENIRAHININTYEFFENGEMYAAGGG